MNNLIKFKSRFMRAALMLTLAVMTSPIEAATHFGVDGLRYEVNSDETSVTLFESNAIYSSELIIPASVTDNNITYSVTAIIYWKYWPTCWA
jgi:hypothetical protein